MSRTVVIAANWKMHKLRAEARAWARDMDAWLEAQIGRRLVGIEIVAAVPFTGIVDVADGQPGFAVFAQNASEHDHGAYTGEVSIGMLRDAGAHGVVLGHSERRTLFGETDAVLARKVRAALDGGLKPMLCVGETLEQRDAGDAEQIVMTQLRAGLDQVTADDVERGLTIAYEPVWAIGTGRTATPEQAQAMHLTARAALADAIGSTAADVPILYGGSVKAANAAELLSQPDIDGALVGGASLEVEDFAQIVAAGIERARRGEAVEVTS